MNMIYWLMLPDVGGELGPATVFDYSLQTPGVKILDFWVSNWSGDDLFACPPYFIVTERLGEELREADLTGYEVRKVKAIVSPGPRGGDHLPSRLRFRWLDVKGEPERDDFGLTSDGRLVVSDLVLDVLSYYKTRHCIVEAYPPETA